MVELKRCPFCGSENVYLTFRQEHWFGTKEPIVFCNICKIEFNAEDDSLYTNVAQDYEYRREKTVEAWNRRYEPSEQARWLDGLN